MVRKEQADESVANLVSDVINARIQALKPGERITLIYSGRFTGFYSRFEEVIIKTEKGHECRARECGLYPFFRDLTAKVKEAYRGFKLQP